MVCATRISNILEWLVYRGETKSAAVSIGRFTMATGRANNKAKGGAIKKTADTLRDAGGKLVGYKLPVNTSNTMVARYIKGYDVLDTSFRQEQ